MLTVRAGVHRPGGRASRLAPDAWPTRDEAEPITLAAWGPSPSSRVDLMLRAVATSDDRRAPATVPPSAPLYSPPRPVVVAPPPPPVVAARAARLEAVVAATLERRPCDCAICQGRPAGFVKGNDAC